MLCFRRMNERGVRMPKTGDPVVNRRGRAVGWVTSAAVDVVPTLAPITAAAGNGSRFALAQRRWCWAPYLPIPAARCGGT